MVQPTNKRFLLESDKAVAGGLATLDGGGKLPETQMPPRLAEATLGGVYGSYIGWVSASDKTVGMVGDAVTLTDASITSGSTALTSQSGGFKATDVGKSVVVPAAGASGVPLRTTVSAYQSATTVVLAAAAATTVANGKAVYGTNNTAAFIAGVVAAAAKKKIFTLVAGDAYLIDATTITADNVRIYGYMSTLISTMWSADNSLGLYVNGNNLEFKGFTLDLAAPDNVMQAGYMNYDMMRVGGKIGGAYASGLTIQDCIFPNAAAGVNAYKTAHVRIENNTVIRSHGNSIGAVSCKEDVVIARNYCFNGNDDLLAVTADAGTGAPTARVSVIGNILDTTDASCIKIAGADRVTIQGNNVRNSYSAAIMVLQDTVFNLQPSHRVIISGNTVQDGGQCYGAGRSHANMSTSANGVQVTSNAADCIISGNSITNSAGRAISAPLVNAGLTVADNRIVGAVGAGISVGNVSDSTFVLARDLNIHDNIIRNVQTGIAVGSATGANIHDNIIRSYSSGGGTGYRGIQYGYLKNAVISKNIITNDDGGGATVFDSAAGQSVNLTVKDNGESTVATVVPGVVLQRTRAGGFIAPQTASRGTVTPVLNRLFTYPITLSQASTAVSLNLKVTTAGSADATVRAGLWADDGTTNPTGAPLASASITGLDTTGIKTAVISAALQPGTYWVFVVVQGATTMPAFTAATGQVTGMPATADPGATTTALNAEGQSGVVGTPPTVGVYTAGVPLVTVGI